MSYSILSLYNSILHNCHDLNVLSNVRVVNLFVKGNNSRYISLCQYFFKTYLPHPENLYINMSITIGTSNYWSKCVNFLMNFKLLSNLQIVNTNIITILVCFNNANNSLCTNSISSTGVQIPVSMGKTVINFLILLWEVS